MTKKPPLDVYQHVTDILIQAIEANPGSFEMPWHRGGLGASLPRNPVTKQSYQGVNCVSLWAVSELCQYPTTEFASYRQWNEIGAQVKSGAKGALVVFYKEFAVDPDPENPDDNGMRKTARHSFVFNASQVEGYTPSTVAVMEPLQRHEHMQRLVKAVGADVRVGGDAAYYVPSADYIQMPDERCFRQSEERERMFHYESTLAHELVHLSGHPKRLNRDLTGRFGSDSYAWEECCAEFGAAMICAQLGISAEPRKDHAQYLAHWVRRMKEDKKAIFTAAAKASEAARYLLGFLPQEVQDAA